MHSQTENFSPITVLRNVSVLSGLLLLGACASPPVPPDQALQAAEMAITSAEQARVADYASAELGRAQVKLAAANSAVEDEDMRLAEWLAHESRAEAELALAMTQEAKAKAVNEEMRKSTNSLKQEMQRHTGGQQ